MWSKQMAETIYRVLRGGYTEFSVAGAICSLVRTNSKLKGCTRQSAADAIMLHLAKVGAL